MIEVGLKCIVACPQGCVVVCGGLVTVVVCPSRKARVRYRLTIDLELFRTRGIRLFN